MFDQVREFFLNHKKAFYVLCSVFAFIFVITIARTMFLDNETKKIEEEAVSAYSTELSAKQESIVAEYTDSVNETIAIFSNNAWVDDSGAKSLVFNDREFIERYNGEESISSYAICSYEKVDNGQKTNSEMPLGVEYRMTCLLGNEQYVQLSMYVNYVDNSSNSAISSIALTSKKMFTNAEMYKRVKRADSLKIDNWDKNINQYVDYKYDEMYQQLCDHCYKFYPQVSNITWNRKVVMNYEDNSIVVGFTIPVKSPRNIDVVYYKSDGRFEITKSKS